MLSRHEPKTREQRLEEENRRLRRALQAAAAPVPKFFQPDPVKRAQQLLDELARRAANAARAIDDTPRLRVVATGAWR